MGDGIVEGVACLNLQGSFFCRLVPGQLDDTRCSVQRELKPGRSGGVEGTSHPLLGSEPRTLSQAPLTPGGAGVALPMFETRFLCLIDLFVNIKCYIVLIKKPYLMQL